MRRSIEDMRIVLPDGSQSVRITASFGIVTLRLELEDSVDSLIGRADEALYKAKHEGRNRVCVAD
jgi:diguanylate cyclase (GGDEF)-like protein